MRITAALLLLVVVLIGCGRKEGITSGPQTTEPLPIEVVGSPEDALPKR